MPSSLYAGKTPNGVEAHSDEDDDEMPPLIAMSDSEDSDDSDDDIPNFTGFLVIAHPFGNPAVSLMKTRQWLTALLGCEPGTIYSHQKSVTSTSSSIFIIQCLIYNLFALDRLAS